MDIPLINYYSPAVFASVITTFAAFFILFRSYRLRLNALFGIMGIFGSVWFFLIYLLRNNFDPSIIAYIVTFSTVFLYFLFFLLDQLNELDTRLNKTVLSSLFSFSRWENLLMGIGIIFISLAFFVFIFLGFLDGQSLIVAASELTVFFFSFIFFLAAAFFILRSVLNLTKKMFVSDLSILEKLFALFFSYSWLFFSLGCLVLSIKTLGAWFSPLNSTNFSSAYVSLEAFNSFAGNNLFSFLIVSALIIILILAVVITKRYFLSFKVLATQVITTLIIMLNLVNILNSGSTEEIVLRALLIIVLLFLSRLLVQSMISEIQKRKHIHITTKKIYEANKNLSLLDQAKSDFINSASHQLRNPISVIKGISSMLLDETYGKLTSSIKDALEKIYISNERLIGLIEDLLDISHLEEGRVDFNFAKINLNEIAKKSVLGLIIQAKNKKVYLKFHPSQESQLLVWADGQKLTEAISNLIDNAIKYTRKGGISVEVKKVKNYAQVSVRDTGIGLKKEEISHLFQKFVRAGRGNKVSPVGTGLGLYVVDKMVKAHKGKILAKSAGENRGSTFIIRLPIDLKNPPSEKFIKKVVMQKKPA